jgi:hypothetical protein
MFLLLRVAAAVAGGLLLAGCVDRPMPADVSERFWRAVQQNDVAAVRRLVTAESLRSTIGGADLLDIGEVTLGRTVIDGDSAWVDARVTVDADRPFSVPVTTVLRMERKQWRVDYRATMSELARGGQVAKVFDDIRRLGEQFSGQADGTLDELERVVPELQRELRNLEEKLRARLPELQRRLEEFAREMEKAVRELPGEIPKKYPKEEQGEEPVPGQPIRI